MVEIFYPNVPRPIKIRLGSFFTEEETSKAYMIVAEKYHGNFAHHLASKIDQTINA